jgi:menaquinone-dependent protoporphyrinogen oxidase
MDPAEIEHGVTRRRFLKIGGVAAGTVAIGGVGAMAAVSAPEVDLPSIQIGEGDMKALVVYATKSGCTTGIAEKIGETLAAKGANVDVVAAESAGDPAAYDAVVVGSGIRVGQWHGPAKEWVTANADALKQMPVAFYTCNLTIADEPEKADEVRAYTDALIAESGVTPIDIGLFAGWFEPKSFSFIERTVLKAMKAPQGDRRDWAAIEAWTEGIASQLGVS